MKLDLNQIVFTSKYVIESQSLVIYVVHDHDGYWQFLGSEEIDEKDGRVAALKEMLVIDPTIKDILWLQPGMEARRPIIGGQWETSIYLE